MQTTGKLLLVVLAVCALAMVGCEKTYNIKVTSALSEPVQVKILEGSGPFEKRSFTVAPDGGEREIKIKVDDEDDKNFTFVAGKFSTPFRLDKNAPDPMYFHILPDKLVGPVDKDTKVDYKWDTKVDTKVGGPRFKVE